MNNQKGKTIMSTKLIELQDGFLVEVETQEGEVEQIAGGNGVNQVQGTIDKIKPLLLKVCKPICAVWEELDTDMYIEQAEVEIGLGFEAEGNIFVTKAKTTANLTVKLTIKPKILTS